MFGLLNCQGLCWLYMASGRSPNTAAKFAHGIYPSLDLMLLHDNTVASTSPPWPPFLLGNISASRNQSLERGSGELQTSELYIASSELRPKRSPARHVFRCFTLGPYVIALSVPLQRCNGEEQRDGKCNIATSKRSKYSVQECSQSLEMEPPLCNSLTKLTACAT